eukprot:15774_1
MTIASCSSFVSSRSQKQFNSGFRLIGKHIYRKPWLFILIGLILTLICSLGFLLLKQETRALRLWVPRKSVVWSQYTTIINSFGSYPSKMLLIITSEDESDSILSPSNMNIAYDIYKDIDNITLDYNGNIYDYEQLCSRPYPTAPSCTSDYSNIFGFLFNSQSELWQNSTMIDDIINVNNSAIQGFAGGLQMEDGYISAAQSLILVYELRGTTNETENKIIREFLLAFQDYWTSHAKNYHSIQIQFITDRSMDDEVGRVVSGDIPIFGAALLCMLTYLMFTLGQFSCIKARPWLACSAMLVMLCSLIIGFGVLSFIGMEFNLLCALVPYILLGVGVDDMIILVDTYQRTRISHTITTEEMRLCEALSISGLSISLTSFCSSMAFFIGSTTDLPAMSSFCMVAAWSFVANYFLQFLIFVPLMIYDEKRILKQNNFCLPCCIHHIEIAKKNENENENNNCPISNRFRIQHVMDSYIVPMLSKRICRVLTIILFVIFSGVSIYLSSNLKTESDITKVLPDDSYVLDYLETIEQNFGTSTVNELNIIVENEDMSNEQVRDQLFTLFNALEKEPSAIGTVKQWLYPFTEWVVSNKNKSSLDALSKTMFYQYLQQFANDSTNAVWNSEIIYNDASTPTMIAATRFFLTAFRPVSHSKNYDLYLHWNEICDEYFDSNAFIYEVDYGRSFFRAQIQSLTIENMLFAALGVFAVLLLLLDCRVALFILIVVIMIDIDLLGWMFLFDISLDVVSYVELVMAVGLTVDYVIHTTHAIIDEMVGLEEVNDMIYAEKLRIAMVNTGTSVLKGAFTTFLGVIALAFSQSQAFRIFFLMFLGIIIIAMAHGIILVPAVLGEIKYVYQGIQHMDGKKDASEHEIQEQHNLSIDAMEMTNYNKGNIKTQED